MTGILKFCFIFWLFNGAKGQTAKCDYKNYASYYTCYLRLREANYDEKLTRIDGQHEAGRTDADVDRIETYRDSNPKTFSSIFCQKFPNLKSIKMLNTFMQSIDDDSLKNCKNLDNAEFSGNRF